MVAMLAACSEMATEVAEVDIPRISPMLNVVSFIAPGEPVRVDVFEVVPMAYNRPVERSAADDFRVGNASVSLVCEGTGQRFGLAYVDSLGAYLGSDPQLAISPGAGYRLIVEADGFPKATASTVVPKGDFDIAHSGIETAHSRYEPCRYRIRVTIGNKTDSELMFRVITQTRDMLLVGFRDSTMDGGYGNDTAYAYRMFGDAFVAVQPNSTGFVLHDETRWDSRSFDTLRLDVMLVGPDYYRYHASLEGAWGADYFFEAGNAISNIDGGLGVFAAYIRRMLYITP